MNFKLKTKLLLNSLTILVISLITSPTLANNFSQQKDVNVFIQKMVTTHGFDQKQLLTLFANIEPSAEVIKQISKPLEEASWNRYRKHFITKNRIKHGVDFWTTHEAALSKAEKMFGIPAEIIVAVIGTETFYGKFSGNYPVLQSLATLAFNYPKRAKFFLSELEQFLLLTKEQQLPAEQLKGSYAGAMGIPQFISSAYRAYAIDFAKVGKIDLINNVPNAIGSVANYFKVHGWKPHQPIVHKAVIKGERFKNIQQADGKNPKPLFTLAALQEYDVSPANQDIRDSKAKVSFLELENSHGKEHWLGRDNFYALTRYNHSTNYAMAVYMLSQEIVKRRNESSTNH